MKHISTTPFGRRPISDGYMDHIGLADAPCPAQPLDKWAVMRDLAVARSSFGVSDRDLQVLHALLTFLPSPVLSADAGTVVFPSNATLSARLHGMPESTLRRHIAALVRAGLLLRHDSPNGKRYARRDETGQIARAFGFDLYPLLVRSTEIGAAAVDAERVTAEMRDLREATVLHIRDAQRMMPESETAHCAAIANIQKMLRRKLDLVAMRALCEIAEQIADAVRQSHTLPAKKMSGNDSQNERHIHDSNKTLSDLESEPNAVSLSAVLDACPEAETYAKDKIRSWACLIEAAQRIYPMMGIAKELWFSATRALGAGDAATVVLCILQRFNSINSPGAYLRRIVQKALSGQFSSGRMVRALAVRQS